MDQSGSPLKLLSGQRNNLQPQISYSSQDGRQIPKEVRAWQKKSSPP
jgi:hypothetical protein